MAAARSTRPSRTRPTRRSYINNEGSKAALQASYDMYVRDKSVPISALTNTQTENQDPFIAGQLAMMISHPSEYAVMLDRAKKATGADKEIADAVVANMRYGLIPKGPARRAVVFGGSNVHVFNPDVVDGELDLDAVRALICFSTGPEWSTKLSWVGSNPGNLRGFQTKWMKERLEQIKFLDVTTSMLPNGIPFPVIPESTEIMNIIVPDMLQNALTEKMTVEEAADDAAQADRGVICRAVGPRRMRSPAGARAGRVGSSTPGRDGCDVSPPADRIVRLRSGVGHAQEPRLLPARSFDHRADYLYVLPALGVMLLVIAYPIYYTVYLSSSTRRPASPWTTRSSSASTTTDAF